MFRRHVGTVVTALILGVVFSCLVGFGLMGLIFFSNRRGYDEPPTVNRNDPS
jgi:hypothetical protein